MTPRERFIDALKAHGCKGSGSSWECPAHEDNSPSLSVGEGEDGRLLLNCHADCPIERIVEAVDLRVADLFPAKVERSILETYPYTDEDGKLLYEVVRYVPKDFRQRRPDGQGGWEWNLKGVQRVLYRLPELLDAISLGETIYVCEGEKDVHALEKAGVVATTNSGGAGKWDPAFTRILENAENVVLVADNDAPGLLHMAHIGDALNGTPYRIVIPRKGKDVSEHLAAGLGVDALITPVTNDSENRDEKAKPAIDRKDALMFRKEHVTWLDGYEGFIPMGMVTLLAGLPGLGKSMLVCRITADETRLGHHVCIAAAEDSIEHVLLPRLIAAGADLNFVSFLSYKDEHGEGPILLPDHGNLLRDAVIAKPPSLLAVDPIGSFMGRAVDAWKATDVRAALGPFKTIAEVTGCAICLVAHLNKGTGAYLDRVSDSAAFGQLVRSGLLFGRDPADPDLEAGDRRVLVSGKLNVGLRPAARNYRMVPVWIPADDGLPPDISTARLEYTGDSDVQSQDLLTASKQIGEPQSPETTEATHLLVEFLNDGPRSGTDVKAEAKRWGLSMKPVYNAAKRLGVKQEREKGSFQAGTYWRLPD